MTAVNQVGYRTGALPAPVGVLVGIALRAAVRRWPAGSKEEIAAEWRAELHEITHDIRSSSGQRAWRSLAYAMSLACARHGNQRTRGTGMRTTYKAVLGLMVTPAVLSASPR
ncbi:MAG: hypothetical protein ACRDT8_23955 [Micromonosporaceae bacterium]